LRRFLAIAVCLMLSLAATACTHLPFTDKPIVLQCPGYSILEDAASLTDFQDGPGRDITDISFKAKMGNVKLVCQSHIDNDTNSGTLDVQVSPVIGVEMGVANKTQTATLPYFVVVLDPEKKILYHEALSMTVSFKGNRTRLVATAPPTTIELPITPKIRNNYYRIFSGFILTKDQAAFNRKVIRQQLQ